MRVTIFHTSSSLGPHVQTHYGDDRKIDLVIKAPYFKIRPRFGFLPAPRLEHTGTPSLISIPPISVDGGYGVSMPLDEGRFTVDIGAWSRYTRYTITVDHPSPDLTRLAYTRCSESNATKSLGVAVVGEIVRELDGDGRRSAWQVLTESQEEA